MEIKELIINKSRFIGIKKELSWEQDIENTLKEIRQEHKNATHICYAYVYSIDKVLEKCSDDGEPKGTAGAPIMGVIKKRGAKNTLVIVVRYFGGIELGKSRLTRVYNAVAAGVLNEAKKFKMVYCNEVEIKVSYQNYGAVNKLFTESNVHIIEQKNDESMPIMRIAVPVKASEKLIASIRAKTRGAGAINKYGNGFYKFPYKNGETME